MPRAATDDGRHPVTRTLTLSLTLTLSVTLTLTLTLSLSLPLPQPLPRLDVAENVGDLLCDIAEGYLRDGELQSAVPAVSYP